MTGLKLHHILEEKKIEKFINKIVNECVVKIIPKALFFLDFEIFI